MTRQRGLWRAALLFYLLFLAFVLLRQSPAAAIGVVTETSRVMVELGVPPVLTVRSRVEFMLNAAMFTPITVLAWLSFPRHHWATWVVYAFIGSAAVEFVQGLLLASRSAQMVDVVANTFGALLGVVPAWLVVAISTSRRQS